MPYNRTYYFDFTSMNGWDYRLEFYDSQNTATPFNNKKGELGPNPVEINYGSDGGGLYAEMKASTLNIEFVVRGFLDQMYINRLREDRTERDVYVHLYRENVNGTANPTYSPIWSGYLLNDLSGDKDEDFPTIVSMKAVDGIASLKYYDFIPSTTTQASSNLYDKDDTFLPTGNNGYDTSRTFIEWISLALGYGGFATNAEGRVGTPGFDVSINWYNGNMTATTIDPLLYSKVQPQAFYKQEEENGLTKWKPKNCYDVIQGICRIWGMRFIFWRGRYKFIQINEYEASESGTNAAPVNMRRFMYEMDATPSGSSSNIGTWWSKYQITLNTGYATADSGQQRLKGGVYGILPRYKKVTANFLNVSDINHFTTFPLIANPYYTAAGPQNKYEETIIGTFTDLAPAGVGQTFYSEIWLNFANGNLSAKDFEFDYTMVARASGAASWTHQLSFNWNTSSFEWLTFQVYQWYMSVSNGMGNGILTLPPGQSSHNLAAAGMGIAQFIPFHNLPVSLQTGDVELGWVTKTGYSSTSNQIALHGRVSPYTSSNNPADNFISYQNTTPNTGMGSSVLSPIVNGQVGITASTASITQTGDDSAFHVIKDIMFGDTFSLASAGSIAVYDGANWINSGYAGFWGRDTLSGNLSLAQLLATEHLQRQFKNVKTYNAKFALGNRGQYYNDGTANRPNYACPISKFLIPGNNQVGMITAEYIMHTGTFHVIKDEWSMKLMEFKDFALSGTTNSTGTTAGTNTGGVGLPAPTTQAANLTGGVGARMANPNSRSEAINKLKISRLQPITTINAGYDAAAADPTAAPSLSITSLTIVPIGVALLKSGDKISVQTRIRRQGEAGAEVDPINANTYQFTLDADQGASDTSLSVEATTIYNAITIGDVVTIDSQNLIQQYQRKTEGEIAGFSVDADGLTKGGIEITGWLDSDTMSGASANSLATSESIKAYVDSQSHSDDFFMAICTAPTLTSATDGAAYAATITFDEIGASEGSDISLASNNIEIASTTGKYQFMWNVVGDTSVTNNRSLFGVKLQLGTYNEGEGTYEYTDLDPSHCYIYCRGTGAIREGSTAGSIIVDHDSSSALKRYRLVFWKEESTTATTKGTTAINGTQLTIKKLT